MTFRQFACESPDDIFKNPKQVTFIYFERSDDILSDIFADSEVWEGIRKRTPWVESEIEEAIENLPYPCLVASDSTMKMDVAVVDEWGEKRVLKGTTWAVTAHYLLIGALVQRVVKENLMRKNRGRIPPSHAEFMGIVEGIVNAMNTSNFGLQGRLTDRYLSTWSEADMGTVQKIMDMAEAGKLTRFADRVVVDTSGKVGQTDNYPSFGNEEEYTLTRNRSGRFAS